MELSCTKFGAIKDEFTAFLKSFWHLRSRMPTLKSLIAKFPLVCDETEWRNLINEMKFGKISFLHEVVNFKEFGDVEKTKVIVQKFMTSIAFVIGSDIERWKIQKLGNEIGRAHV